MVREQVRTFCAGFFRNLLQMRFLLVTIADAG